MDHNIIDLFDNPGIKDKANNPPAGEIDFRLLEKVAAQDPDVACYLRNIQGLIKEKNPGAVEDIMKSGEDDRVEEGDFLQKVEIARRLRRKFTSGQLRKFIWDVLNFPDLQEIYLEDYFYVMGPRESKAGSR